MSGRIVRGALFKPTATGPDGKVDARQQIASDIQRKYGPVGDLVDIFSETKGPGVDKWHHYVPLYERYFGAWRGRPVRFLEIGVFRGGSLDMWRRFLGPEAVIFGVDIDPGCARFDGQSGKVRIGSQADPDFLNSVIDEMGGVDVVLDDGSHRMEHVHASLAAVFPRLSLGGVYVIEDLHTAYWRRWGGGLSAPANFFNTVRGMIDDLHCWYHKADPRHPATAGGVTGIHIHDSLCVLEKGTLHSPVRSLVGSHLDAVPAEPKSPSESKAS
jgi:hypothetical protein